MRTSTTVAMAAATAVLAVAVPTAYAVPAGPVQTSDARPVADVADTGPANAITDVSGLHVGQVQATDGGYLTGTTVLYAPETAVAGADVRGGAPGTKELDLLDPLNSNPGVNAVVLTGGSAYGLDSASGVMRWLEERGEGVRVGGGVVPIVPGAVIFDLNRGGDFSARPTPEWGYQAIDVATDGPVRTGVVGAGTGARAGGLKGGVGTASTTLPDGTVVGALVVVNAVGSTVDPRDCTLMGAALAEEGEFAGLRAPSRAECARAQRAAAGPTSADGTAPETSLNTTIAVIATDATLEKAAATKLAGVGHDGLARAINPLHTLNDGDTVIGMSTGKADAPLAINDPADSRQLNQIFNAGANTLSRAVADAMLAADSAGGITSYCDTYPTACRRLDRSAVGEAPSIKVDSSAHATVPTVAASAHRPSPALVGLAGRALLTGRLP